MASTDVRPGDAGTRPQPARLVHTIVGGILRRVSAVPSWALVVALACVQWILVAVTAFVVGHDGSLLIVVPQVVVLLPVASLLIYRTALRLGGRTFAAWAAALWVVLPYAGIVYANPSFRHDYAHRFLPHLLGLADDPRFAGMVAFLAASFFALRAIDTGLKLDLALAVAGAGLGAAFVPRAALVALAPAVGLALGGEIRRAVTVGAVLAILLACVGGAVAAGLLSSPFAHVGIHGPANALASLSENFWSGRVIEWLAIAGVAGALRGRRTAGAVIGVGLLAAFLSLHGEKLPAARNLSLLHALLPVWPAVTLAIASLPLLVPHKRPPEGRAARTPADWLALVASTLSRRLTRPSHGDAPWAAEPPPSTTPARAPMWARAAIASLFVFMLFVGVWNAARYPIMLGYDAQEHIAYADVLINSGRTPTVAEGGEYYAPPGYYAIAGAATWVGGKMGLAEPHQAAQYLNVVFVLLTGALLLVLARLLFPRRPGVWVSTLGFFAFLPVVAKTAAMFHPETLNMLMSTAAVTLATWMLLRRRFALRWLCLLGLTLGVGQLVRASSLFTLAAVALAFLAALATPSFRSHMPLRRIGLAAAAVALIAVPLYASQVVTHKTQPGLSLSSLRFSPATADGPPFFALSLDDVFHRPVRPFYVREALPETYTEIWGDWMGAFAWSGYSAGPSPQALKVLQDQSWIGVLPTFLAIAGWLGLLALAARRRLERIPLAPLLLLPVIAVAAYLWRSYVLPSPDGDLTKASYLLTTVPAWALGFGLVVDRLSRRRLLAFGIAAALLAFGILELRFMLYGIRDHNPIF